MEEEEKFPDYVVQGVATAIYESTVAQARSALAKRSVNSSHLPELFLRLRTETEIARVHIFFSYLDDQIQDQIASNLSHLDTQTARDRVFGLNGPLATFNTRVLLAYHLGWIGSDLKRRLDCLRKIRNEYGHAAYRITSSDPKIRALWRSLDHDLTAVVEEVRNVVSKTKPPVRFHDMEDMPEARRQMCQLAFLAYQTIVSLLVRPIANGFHVSRRDVMGNWDETPEAAKRLAMDFARAWYHCLAK